MTTELQINKMRVLQINKFFGLLYEKKFFFWFSELSQKKSIKEAKK
jgi:hypothetical protein